MNNSTLQNELHTQKQWRFDITTLLESKIL